MAKTKFDNIKNRVLLVVIVFLLSYLLTALIDKEYTMWFFRRRTVVCRLYDRFRRVVADKFRIRGTICLL